MEERSTDHDPDETGGTLTEAVAVFHDANSFQEAIDGLLMRGFCHSDLSVLADERTITKRLGSSYTSTTELEDNPETPRSLYVEDESVGDAEGGIISAAAYVPAIIGSVAVTASGGTLLGAIAAAAIAGGAGAGAGALLARSIGKEHARHLEQHIRHGGLLLWVRTSDREREESAIDILKRSGGQDVHLHALPPLSPVQSIPVRRPFLSISPAA